MRLRRAAKRSPPGAREWARCATVKPLQREVAHLTRRDGRRRILVDHGDGMTIEEAERFGLPAHILAFAPPY